MQIICHWQLLQLVPRSCSSPKGTVWLASVQRNQSDPLYLSTHLSSLLYIQPLGQQIGNVDEAHEVVHITLYAASHPRILNLHGKPPPIVKLASMHLPQSEVCSQKGRREDALVQRKSDDTLSAY